MMEHTTPNHDNPWTTLSTREIYANEWLRLREDQVVRPDGAQGIYGVIETRKATGVVALTPEREVYLVGQYRYPTQCYSWEIPEGGADEGEEALDAAKRELAEETGVIAKQWTPLSENIQVSNCISSELGYLYLAEDLEEVGAHPEGTEMLEVKRVPFEKAVSMVESGEIQDGMSIMAILLAERHLSRRGRSYQTPS